MGDATVPCLCASYRFRRIGFNCYFDFDPDMQLITASNIASDDVVIAISHSGMSRTVNARCKSCSRGRSLYHWHYAVSKVHNDPIL
ncbi:MAG: hypothetical protein ACLS61_14635 [Ruminococcus sp.]